ncbi:MULTISPECIES: DUF5954 family protein [unclassified Streptomyces]|uniref:DUF5954 family protein n=1 Tax=unclassified Streptomyces TaxID=2593676 RepID=UPI001660EC61|nr:MULTISPECIES: DUF5954 family protein [unclassified Streptomyces]MBD0708400.1 hypothetical protein [Streptomyces sp. CBMA291]MBD0714843.1 hypothetical protein [Streptomyces sp. CBMA370]
MDEDWKQRLDAARAGLVQREDPVAWVTEVDAAEAAVKYPGLSVRGALFGVAAQEPGEPWRIVLPVRTGMPQETRDSLQSHFFFRAKDETDVPAERRALMAAVDVLTRERVNDLDVLGVRYRVIRGDEFARSNDSGLEPPRPTDPEPVFRVWERQPVSRRCPDTGLVLDPDQTRGPMAEALRFGMRDFHYTGKRYPSGVRDDSRKAIQTHPDIALLPVTYGIVEREDDVWLPRSGLEPTPHDARRGLYDDLTDLWGRIYEWDDDKRERYRRAGELFRAAGSSDEATVDGRVFRICRVERMVRFGPDGPEGPRHSDVDEYDPTTMHPRMDDDGTLHYD